MLTQRLEVRLDPRTMRLLREEARRRRLPMGELVRDAIDRLLREDRQERLTAAEALCQVEAPVAEWEDMKREIEAGHLEPGA